jgi:hypothetical protein
MKTTLAAVDRVWGVELGFAVQAVEQPHCICSSGPHSCKKVRKRVGQQDTAKVLTKYRSCPLIYPVSMKNFERKITMRMFIPPNAHACVSNI